MTISSTNRKAGPYIGTGLVSAFPFAFKIFSASDVLAVRADSTGTEAALTLNTDYTVALNTDQNANPGGTITLSSPLGVSFTLTVTSSLPYLQPTDLTNNGGFYPRVLTDALDRLTIFVQQLAESVGRSLKTAISTPSGFNATLPAPVPYNVIGWNADGTGFQNSDPAGDSALASDIASTSDNKGAGQVGFLRASSYTSPNTVGAWLKSILSHFDTGYMSGDAQHYFAHYAPRAVAIYDGTAAAPVTGGPTVKISRIENMNGATNGGTANNEANAALVVGSVGVPGSTMQSSAGYFFAKGAASAAQTDALGISGLGWNTSGDNGGIGFYGEGRSTGSAISKAMAYEGRVTNLTASDMPYSPSGSSRGIGFWATCDSDVVTSLCGAAFAAGRVNTAQWDVGMGFTSGSVKTATFRDDSDATTVFDINGSHTYGLDFTGAAIFGPCIRTGTNSTELSGAVFFDGIVSPVTISATANDYAPAGIATANVLRVSASGAYDITGLANGTEGRAIVVHNVGGATITLKNSSAMSVAANRFLFKADVTLAANGTVELRYDGVSAGWRIKSIY